MSKILITNIMEGRKEFWFCTTCVFYKFPHICPFFAQYDWILWINNWPSDLRKTEKKLFNEIFMKRERKGNSVVKLNFVSQSFSVMKISMVLICSLLNPYSCVFQKYFPLPAQTEATWMWMGFSLKRVRKSVRLVNLGKGKKPVAKECKIGIKTLPKAQRTRGLSSYHNFRHKSRSNFNFRT